MARGMVMSQLTRMRPSTLESTVLAGLLHTRVYFHRVYGPPANLFGGRPKFVWHTGVCIRVRAVYVTTLRLGAVEHLLRQAGANDGPGQAVRGRDRQLQDREAGSTATAAPSCTANALLGDRAVILLDTVPMVRSPHVRILTLVSLPSSTT